MEEMYDIWETSLSGDSKHIGTKQKNEAIALVETLNKKCSWTVYYHAIPQLINA